jgi:hypothetical protein
MYATDNIVHMRWLHTSTSVCTYICRFPGFPGQLTDAGRALVQSCSRRCSSVAWGTTRSAMRHLAGPYLWMLITRCLDGIGVENTGGICFLRRASTLTCFCCVLTVIWQLRSDASLMAHWSYRRYIDGLMLVCRLLQRRLCRLPCT